MFIYRIRILYNYIYIYIDRLVPHHPISCVRENLDFKVIKNLSPMNEKTFETLTIEVKFKNCKTLLTSIYRSPNPPPNLTAVEATNEFLNSLDTFLDMVAAKNLNSYIFLGSNINLLAENNQCIQYIDTIMSNGYLQIITKATRIQGNSYSLLDHIVTNNIASTELCGTLIDDISDHFMNYVIIPVNATSRQNVELKKRNFSNENIESFKTALSGLNWRNVTSTDDTNMEFEQFWMDFVTLFELNLPETTVKFNKNLHPKQPFLTKGLITSRKNKLELQKLAIRSPSDLNKSKYKQYRNLYASLLRKSKQMYYEKTLRANRKNPKKTWDVIKEATFGHTPKSKIEKISSNGNILTESVEISNEFNNFFTNVGTEIANEIHPTVKQYSDYLPENQNVPTLDLGNTGPIHISDIIKTLEPKKSTDVDGLSMYLIKRIITEINVPLAHIFNLSLSKGVFPEKLKTAKVVPIFKSGRKDLCDNYRPISLLSTLSKILEKIVSIQLTNHLDINKLIYKHQYGFQKNKSTEHSLLHLSNFINTAINENKYCIGVFLDLKKAFDVCSHKILLKKLERLGIKNNALKWFKSYLENRYQVVEINGIKSNRNDINISVIQGSILGPILFLCFINDLPYSTILFTLLFADDTACLASGNNLEQLVNLINTELNKLAIWFRANKMSVNLSKTKYIIFHAKNKKIEDENLPVVFDSNEPGEHRNPSFVTPLEKIHASHACENSRTYKLLGINIEEHLTLETHCAMLGKKLTKSLYFLKRVQNILTKEALRSLYFAIFHAHLLYCPIVLSGTTIKAQNKIKILQKKAIRIITKSKNREHTGPLFEKLKILPYEKILFMSKINFMHSVRYKYSPESFQSTWQLNENRNVEYVLRNAMDYNLPVPRTEFFKKQPMYSLPLIWNSFNDMKLQPNKITFQKYVKDLLLSELAEDQAQDAN